MECWEVAPMRNRAISARAGGQGLSFLDLFLYKNMSHFATGIVLKRGTLN
jgi:hypothetical protein